MKITWEDRRNRGMIDEVALRNKPEFSFTYAWFLVSDEIAQYVVSHDSEYSNQDMTPEQRQEVIDFYIGWTPPVAVPLSLEGLKQERLSSLKEQRELLELAPINGISVEKDSHRSDIKEYAALLKQYAEASEEERQQFSQMLNPDGSINWTLADDSTRPVTAEELEQTYQYFFIRKATLMRSYQTALAQLASEDVKTAAQINDITLEVSNV